MRSTSSTSASTPRSRSSSRERSSVSSCSCTHCSTPRSPRPKTSEVQHQTLSPLPDDHSTPYDCSATKRSPLVYWLNSLPLKTTLFVSSIADLLDGTVLCEVAHYVVMNNGGEHVKCRCVDSVVWKPACKTESLGNLTLCLKLLVDHFDGRLPPPLTDSDAALKLLRVSYLCSVIVTSTGRPRKLSRIIRVVAILLWGWS